MHIEVPFNGWMDPTLPIYNVGDKKKAYDTWSMVVWMAWVRKAGPEPPVCLGFRIGTREVHNKLEKNRCVCTLGSVTLGPPLPDSSTLGPSRAFVVFVPASCCCALWRWLTSVHSLSPGGPI